MSLDGVSHPTRGEWIEMQAIEEDINVILGSHPTRGEWIEIRMSEVMAKVLVSLTPHGVSGLK